MAGEKAHQAAEMKARQADEKRHKAEDLKRKASELDAEVRNAKQDVVRHISIANSSVNDDHAAREDIMAAEAQHDVHEKSKEASEARSESTRLLNESSNDLRESQVLADLARKAEAAEGLANDAAVKANS